MISSEMQRYIISANTFQLLSIRTQHRHHGRHCKKRFVQGHSMYSFQNASFRCFKTILRQYKNICGTQFSRYLFSARFVKNLFVHSCTIHVPDELIVLVFAYELFDINRVCIVVVLPSGRTPGTTTSLNFLSLFIFYFLLLICFLVSYSLKVFNFHQRSIFTLAL